MQLDRSCCSECCSENIYRKKLITKQTLIPLHCSDQTKINDRIGFNKQQSANVKPIDKRGAPSWWHPLGEISSSYHWTCRNRREGLPFLFFSCISKCTGFKWLAQKWQKTSKVHKVLNISIQVVLHLVTYLLGLSPIYRTKAKCCEGLLDVKHKVVTRLKSWNVYFSAFRFEALILSKTSKSSPTNLIKQP